MTLELGGNITLVGFSDKEFTELIVVKKMVGQYARKLSDSTGLDSLKITNKTSGNQNEVHTHLVVKGQDFSSSSEAHNLYVALDDSLKKALLQVQKTHDKS